jgi:uncharacterized membrane protein
MESKMYRVNDINTSVDQASMGFKLSIESCLQQGFNLFRQGPGLFFIYTMVVALIMVNPLTGLFLGGPALVGYYVVARHFQRAEAVGLSDFFQSFHSFIPLLLLQVLISLLVMLGLLLLVLPGIYLAVSYVFAHFFVHFHGISPMEALRLSRRTVSGNFGQIFLLCLVLLGVNLLGVMAFGLGLLVSMPLSACVLYAAFDDIIGLT